MEGADIGLGGARLALVIGNSACENITPLANPINDAHGRWRRASTAWDTVCFAPRMSGGATWHCDCLSGGGR